MRIILQCFWLFLTLSIPEKLNNNLDKVSLWANEWKMSFNSDPFKQAQEEFFSRKINKGYNPPLLSNNSMSQQRSSQKQLGIHVDEELTFKHIKEKINK